MALRSREPTPAVQGGSTHNRGREGAKLVAAQLPVGDLHGGQRHKIHPQPREYPGSKYRKTEDSNKRARRRAYLEQDEGAYTGEWYGGRNLGKERGSGPFHGGRPSEGPPPSLETTRLLPS